MAHTSSVDRLIAESERLRAELLKTAARLETFAGELLVEVRDLRSEAKDQVEMIEGEHDVRGEGAVLPGDGPSRPPG